MLIKLKEILQQQESDDFVLFIYCDKWHCFSDTNKYDKILKDYSYVCENLNSPSLPKLLKKCTKIEIHFKTAVTTINAKKDSWINHKMYEISLNEYSS